MKHPQTPPRVAPSEIAGDLEMLRATPYLHWDELRHRPPPAGRTSARWWTQLKTLRRLTAVPLPLRDVSGAPFAYSLPPSLQRALFALERRLRGQADLPPGVTGATRDRYLLGSLREEAITSSQLEGAATTRDVAVKLLETNRAPRTTGERMILNNYRAMQWLRDRLDTPLTPSVVLELQRILTDGTIEPADAAGRLRRADERVVVADTDGSAAHVPPPAAELDARLAAMCAFANDDDPPQAFTHPIIRAIALHFWLAYDHPFVDGNGRTARALFYWSMLRQGYWLTEFLAISKTIKEAPARYARAFLFVETDDNDLTYFLLHQLDVLERSVADLFDHLRAQHAEAREAARLLPRIDANDRQLAVLAEALRDPGVVFTIAEHQQRYGLAYDTARLDLLELAARGLLAKQKRGKAFVFVPGKKLAKASRPRP